MAASQPFGHGEEAALPRERRKHSAIDVVEYIVYFSKRFYLGVLFVTVLLKIAVG